MIWSECKEIWSDGPREYVMHLWNVLDFGMLSIFVASFTARFMAFLKASKAQQYVDMHVPDEDLSNASLPEEVAYFTYGEQECRVSMLAKEQAIHPSSIHPSVLFCICSPFVLLLCSTCIPPNGFHPPFIYVLLFCSHLFILPGFSSSSLSLQDSAILPFNHLWAFLLGCCVSELALLVCLGKSAARDS